ncbi:UPAR/Ly6 domain-containing protein bero-like [Calliphora vicina]|uniref:UPAR/Ly6 domain-containing protein bero-like n=1 Tax=Calliphora vicina TaxID=7373 RepID=UPI00325B9FD3
MLLKFEILTFYILASFYLAKSNTLDTISTATSLFSSKSIKCITCSSLWDDDCKNDTKVKHRSDFQGECRSDATGCVKQFVETTGGRNATFRECYYGSIFPGVTTFGCEKIDRSVHYTNVKCYKCRGDLCNSSNRLKHSSYDIMLFILTVMLISFMLKL